MLILWKKTKFFLQSFRQMCPLFRYTDWMIAETRVGEYRHIDTFFFLCSTFLLITNSLQFQTFPQFTSAYIFQWLLGAPHLFRTIFGSYFSCGRRTALIFPFLTNIKWVLGGLLEGISNLSRRDDCRLTERYSALCSLNSIYIFSLSAPLSSLSSHISLTRCIIEWE